MEEQDVEQPMGEEPFDWLAAFEEGLANLRSGQILTGTIMQVRPNEVLVDVRGKAEGVIEGKELDALTPEERAALREGGEIRVYVVRSEGPEGNPILSISRAKMEQDWAFAEQQHADDAIFEATVGGANRGGLIVPIGQLRGFVPISQVATLRRSQGDDEQDVQQRLNELTGQSLKFKVMEVDRARNRLILSERAAEREWRKDKKERLMATLQEGARLRGEISSLADFGAFVDLGGADGLIHLSELAWGRVQHPSEVVAVGQEVEVEVINVDRERQRIGLSLKRLTPEPWMQFMAAHKPGDRVEAVITKLTNFGAFARLHDQAVEGLIHISELADGHVEKPSDVLSVGDQVTVTIIRIEPERKRLGLSMRAGAVPDGLDEAQPEPLSD